MPTKYYTQLTGIFILQMRIKYDKSVSNTFNTDMHAGQKFQLQDSYTAQEQWLTAVYHHVQHRQIVSCLYRMCQ